MRSRLSFALCAWTCVTAPVALSAANAVQAEVSSATSGAGATLNWTPGIAARMASPSGLAVFSFAGGIRLDNISAAPVDAALWDPRGDRLTENVRIVPGASVRWTVPSTTVILRTHSGGVTETTGISGQR